MTDSKIDTVDLSKATADDFKICDDMPEGKIDIVLPCILMGVDKKPMPDGSVMYIAHIDVPMNDAQKAIGLMATDNMDGIIHLKFFNNKKE